MRELFLEDSEIRIIINLLPDSPVPEGLDPTFYRTLTYEGDTKLQAQFDDLKEKMTDLLID